ncbi:MAG: flagellin FliC [Achromobacter sp.]|nr:flagellin FliC [Achromobacter sp.]
MAAVINTNYLSLVAQNNLNKSQSALGTAIERLSSGLRINSAKDDAAGMAIANRFTSNVRGLTQAARNANDGISLAQTTEGAASEITAHLQRVRELSVQAANGSYSQEQLDSIQDEINERLADINRISEQTDFNGVKVLSDKATPLTLQVGANDNETITLDLNEISVKTLGLDGFNVNGVGIVDNRKAQVSDMIGPNIQLVAGTDNQYDVTETNTAATTTDLMSQMTDGSTIIKTTGAAPAGGGAVPTTTYTYDAAAGNFVYDDTDTDTAVEATIRGQIGAKPIAATYMNKTAQADILITSSGNITDINGKALYWDPAGNLSVNDGLTGGAAPGAAAFTQATLADVTTYMGTGATAEGVKLTVNGTTYQSQAAGTADIKFQATITKEKLAADLKAQPTATPAEVKIEAGAFSLTLQVTQIGQLDTDADHLLYMDDKQQLTTVSKTVRRYEFNPDTGNITAIAGGSTFHHQVAAAIGTDVTDNKDVAVNDYGKKLYVARAGSKAGSLTLESTSKGDKTGDPMKTLDSAFNLLNKVSGQLGAVQNRLESTINNLNNVINNLSGARSRILDADYATEVSNMSRAQILQQAGTSVLAQANQVPQTVLSLLR